MVYLVDQGHSLLNNYEKKRRENNIMKKLVVILSLFLAVGYSYGQKITYPQIASYISSDITAKDQRVYQYILYRINYQEQHIDKEGYSAGMSLVGIVNDSIISPKLAVKALKEIRNNYSEKSKLVNKDYWGGEDDSPILEIYLSDTLWVRYWVECYKHVIP